MRRADTGRFLPRGDPHAWGIDVDVAALLLLAGRLVEDGAAFVGVVNGA